MASIMQGGFLRDSSTGALVISGGGSSSGGGVGVAVPAELKRKLWLPTGMLDGAAAAGDAIDESSPRLNGAQTVTPALGVPYAVGDLAVPAGRTADSITFMSAGSGAASPNYFFALVRQSDLTVLARSADSTAAWGANTPRTLLMTTPWTAAVDTPVYAVVCFTAGTPCSLSAYASHIQSVNRTPVLAGSAGSGVTSAATLPSPITAPVQAAAGVPYASVNSKTAAPAADVSEGLDTTILVGTIAATKTVQIKPVQFPITVQGVSMSLDNTAIAASDTDFWTGEVGKLAALTGTFGNIMATKTTKATGGAAFLTNQAWPYDAVTFDPASQTLTKDDILAIRFTKTGAPANLQGLLVSVRYQIA